MAREILIRIDGDSSGLSKSLGAADRDTARFAGEVRGHFGGMLGAVGQVATAVAGLAAVKFAGGQLLSSISAASDLAETVSKVGVLFGDSAKEIEVFAETASTALGQSKQEALDAAATFAVFGKSAGLSGGQLVDFSTDLTGLASDMASFSNTTPADAIEALGAALRGEMEPIRRYGVLLDDASLRDEAFRLGLVRTTKEALTPQQKVLAANAAIFRQTAAAQGDFERTSGGLANQQRILAAQFANVKTEIGEGLLPVAVQLVTWANSMLPALSEAGDAVARFASKASAAVGPAISRIADVFDTLRAAAAGTVAWVSAHWPQIVATFELVGPPIAAAAAATVSLMLAMRGVAAVKAGAATAAQFAAALGPWGLALAAAAAGFVLLYRHSAEFRRFVDGLVTSARELFAELSAVFKADGLGAALSLLGDKIWQAVQAGFAYLVAHAPEWWAAFTSWLGSTAIPWLAEKTVELAGLLGEWIVHAAQWLAERLPGWLATLAGWMAGTVIPWLAEKAGELAELIAGWVVEGARKLRDNLPKWLEDFVAWTIGKAIPAILEFGWKAQIALVEWVARSAGDLLRALPGWIASFAVWVVMDGIPALARGARALASGLNDAFLGALGFAWDIGVAIVRGIVRGLWDMGAWLGSEVKKLVTQHIPGPIKDVLGISSPSKVTMEMGRQVMTGLRLGMEQGVASLARSAELSMTAGVLGPAAAAAQNVDSAAADAGQMRPVGAQTVIIQLDGREIARAMVPHQRTIVRAAG